LAISISFLERSANAAVRREACWFRVDLFDNVAKLGGRAGVVVCGSFPVANVSPKGCTELL
jgi:hypothetical protein